LRLAPRVSIGLPVYNGERFLAQAIESVLAQTFSDFELVICDNASTDGTRDIAEAYAARDERIFYHPGLQNQGAARNYNRAFSLSHGEYFKWLAADDMIEPRYLEG
jgi:glycosyltransferase involved in cell wall biosynthesis